MSNANNTPTIKADSVAPARAGYLGISSPPSPIDFLLTELERVTGDEVELRWIDSAEQYAVFNVSVGDSMGEGRTRAEAVANAVENYL